ncbi:maleylpyruvate isomerase N-terminal domain-containing protein [Nocardioides sp.]|uniref:maleylpyruvate isomerase N-terminal domain-containing protein n=1 Tax=Nocardioides sp. TaxID=35761 RepID=UPI003D0D9999
MSQMSTMYAAATEHLAGIVLALDDDQLRSKVPGSPHWSVHDVLAHLAGGPSDALTGRMDGAPAPSWTAVHVAERRTTSVDDLIQEIRTNRPALQASIEDNPRPAIVWDVSVHLADLHEALELGRPDPSLWQPVHAAVAPYRLGERVLDVEDYELFRGLFSRRSRSQMLAWGTPLTQEELDELPIFGPRDDDQPVP